MTRTRKEKMKKKTIKRFRDDYRFLSNFYHSPISFKRNIYPTAEHLFQSLKTRDKDQQGEIRRARNPAAAKRIGRQVHLRTDWEKMKNRLMFMVVRLKFSQNPELGRALLRTEEWILIEGNDWHDNHWGNCLCSRCEDIKGENILGEILMKVRGMI